MGKAREPSPEKLSRFADFPFTIFPPSDECQGKCCGNGFVSEPHFVYHLPYPGEESSELVLGKDERTLYKVTVTVFGDGYHETVNIPDTIDVESGEIIVGRVEKSWHVTHESPGPVKRSCSCAYCRPVDGEPIRKRRMVMRVTQNKGKRQKKKAAQVSQVSRKKTRRNQPQENIWNGNNQTQDQYRQQNWPNYQTGYQFQFNYSNYQQSWNYGQWQSNYNYQAHYSYYRNQWAPNYWDKCCRCRDCCYGDYHWESPRNY